LDRKKFERQLLKEKIMEATRKQNYMELAKMDESVEDKSAAAMKTKERPKSVLIPSTFQASADFNIEKQIRKTDEEET
jgi:hypothetical protein